MESTTNLFEKFKSVVATGMKLSNRLVQLQQQQQAVQQSLAETQGAANMLVELDPTLPEQLRKEQDVLSKHQEVVTKA